MRIEETKMKQKVNIKIGTSEFMETYTNTNRTNEPPLDFDQQRRDTDALSRSY